MSGFAIKVRDSGSIRHAFDEARAEFPPDITFGEYQHPTCKNTTRWNSQYQCISSHHCLRKAVTAVVDNSDLKMKSFKLTNAQWDLSADLRDMLEVKLLYIAFLG
jgi:hypothetical protein